MRRPAALLGTLLLSGALAHSEPVEVTASLTPARYSSAACRGSRARAAASIASSSLIFLSSGTPSSGLASV